MKKIIVLIAIIISFGSCNTKNAQKDKQSESSSSTTTHIHDSNCTGKHQSFTNFPIEELNVINRKLTAMTRENFRSWNYNEPERWKYLSEKFADEVIRSYPDASSKKEDISKVFFAYLNQRSSIYFSDEKNKQDLMGKSSAEFKFNLSFLIGIEGYQKWQVFSKNELLRFNQITDSLRKVIDYSYAKNQNNKTKNP